MSKHMNNLSRRFRQAFAKSPKQSRRSRTNRWLRAEQLERRELLAGDLFHNDLRASDVNNDGFVAPNDVLMVVNALNQNGAASEGGASGRLYLDTNNDGELSPIDALVPINDMLLGVGEGSTVVSYQPIALASTFIAAPQFGGFSFVDNGSTDQVVIQGSGKSWLQAGFVTGGQVLISDSGAFVDITGTPDADTRLHNNGIYTVKSVTDSTLTVEGDFITVYPDNVRSTDNSGNPLAGTPFTSTSATFFRPVSSVSRGANFFLGMVVEDLRTMTSTGTQIPDTSKGVFSAYVDVTFDTNSVSASSMNFNRHNNYTGSVSGNFTTAGLIDEAGASAFGGQVGVPVGARKQLVWRTAFTAGNTGGQATFATDPADTSPANDTLLFGINTAIPASMISYNSATIDIVSDISAVNDAPPAFNENSTNNTFNVLSNDSVLNPPGTNPTITQVNGAAVTVNQTIALSNGSLTFLGSSKTGNNFSYTPAAGNAAGTSFTYTISNGQTPAATATATVTLTINAIDDRPVIAGPNSLNTNEDTVLALSGFTITDPDSTNITVTLSLSPNSGTLSQTTFSGTPAQVTSTLNTVTFTPLLDSNAPVTLNISASDGVSQPGTKAVSITINAVNDLPKFTNLPASLTAFLDQTLAIPSFSVSDPDSALTVTLSVDKGMLTRNGTTAQSITITGGPGSVPISGVSYTPPTGVTGSAALTVSVAEGTGTPVSQPAIPISIVPPLLPYAAPDFITIDEGAISGSVDVFSNDLAKSSKANLSITGTSLPIPAAQGTVTQNESTFTYTPPNADFFGTTSFTYTIADSGDAGDGPSTGTVNITVNAVNDPPVITKPTSTPTFAEDSPASAISGLSVTDIDNATVNVSLSVLHGILSAGGQSGSTIQVTNSVLNGLTYKPNANYFGSDTLTISANDGTAPSVTDTVNITITPVNDPPTIVVPGKQSFFTDFDNTFSSIPAPFSIADIDAGNNNVQVDLTIGVGTLTIGSASGVTVTENPGGSNGIRLTGTVSNINTALTSGVKYRTSAPTPTNTPRQLTATVNDLGNTGTLDPALSGAAQVSATKTIDIEVLDFVPIDIIGKVFIDHNANGNRNIGEPEFGGVKVFLSGIDFQGNAVNETAITDEHGNYKFEKLRPNGSSPYTITIEQPAFVRQGASASASLNLDVRGNVTVTGGSLNFSTGGFTPEFADVWDLFALSGGGQGNSSGILFGVQGTQKWSMFAGSGWDLNRFSNARFTPGAGGNSGVLTVFDSATQQDRTANVSTQAGTLTYRGNGADRVYRVIGSSALLGSASNGANPESESGDATTNSAAYARGVDSLFAAGGF